jgi:hypothetical protein
MAASHIDVDSKSHIDVDRTAVSVASQLVNAKFWESASGHFSVLWANGFSASAEYASC